MKLESYITMMDAFLKRRLAMTMNHGVQQEHLVLWKEGKNTETYVIILNIIGELISLTVQRKVYVMKNIRRNARMEYLYGLGRSMKANAICVRHYGRVDKFTKLINQIGGKDPLLAIKLIRQYGNKERRTT